MITDSQCADLCAAIYAGASGFDFYEPGFGADGICYGLKRIDGIDVIVLRGSASMLDWRRDFAAWIDPFTHSRLGPVHAGFLEGMGGAWIAIQRRIGIRAIITGHSLGAARAAILTGLMVIDGFKPQRRVTFGEPSPGFQALADLIAPVPAGSYRNAAGARGHDLITDVPYRIPPLLDYVHPSPLIDVCAPPADTDEWGVFGFHHMPLYQQALRNAADPGVQP